MTTPAILALADGTVFSGVSVGYPAEAVAEVVFNTSMTGYQEILTDPSYARQMVTLTYPHIGNVGCNEDDQESNRTWVSALIMRELSPLTSNQRAQTSLSDYLQQHKITAISEVDTRQLTAVLREGGAQNACISLDVDNPDAAIAKARACPSLQGMNLAFDVSCQQAYDWRSVGEARYHVVAYDYGIKHNILRCLAERGCRLTVVPASTTAAEVLALQPDGIFLSNGPGDPAACKQAIANITELFNSGIPLFGICLGFQLMALAAGAKSVKMKFGHHGANHPIACVAAGDDARVLISSQNHGFAIDEHSLPDDWVVTHRSLFDQSLQGIRHRTQPALGFQGHPEASPGPHDVSVIFDDFIALMTAPAHA